MPFYMYRCQEEGCDLVTEKLRPMDEHREPLVVPCKKRGKCQLPRVLGATQTTFTTDHPGYAGLDKKSRK